LDTKDGGALAMKTYGHLRREHSIAQAQRVSFLGRVIYTADAYSRDGRRFIVPAMKNSARFWNLSELLESR
jgi:hypothetical protein